MYKAQTCTSFYYNTDKCTGGWLVKVLQRVVLHQHGILADNPITNILVCIGTDNTSQSDILYCLIKVYHKP